MLGAVSTRRRSERPIKVAITAGLRKRLEPVSGNFHFSISHHPIFFTVPIHLKAPRPLREREESIWFMAVLKTGLSVCIHTNNGMPMHDVYACRKFMRFM